MLLVALFRSFGLVKFRVVLYFSQRSGMHHSAKGKSPHDKKNGKLMFDTERKIGQK